MVFFRRRNGGEPFADSCRERHAPHGAQPESNVVLREWHATIECQRERLRALSGATESEFLAIGAQLHGFYSRAVETGVASATLVDQTGGAEIRETMEKLEGVIERMGDLLSTMENETEQSTKVLRKTMQLIAGVKEPLGGFKKIMKVLHVLGTSTKIESARLGRLGEGFTTLVDDVENLAVLIHDKSARIMDENSALSARIGETLARVSDFTATQREQARLVLDKSRSSLKTISGIHGKCAEVAAAIAEASREVPRNISEVVTSLQFHDITRQMIEHVEEALGDLTERLKTAQAGLRTGSVSEAAGKELVVESFSICRLQRAQLQHAKEELETAVTGIRDNLRNIADRERVIAQESRSMAGVADGAGDSFFTEIEKNLGLVIVVLAESAEANRNLVQAVSLVAETVSQIATFVNDIETIGEDIELIALNSQIKAARTGDEGAALGVLAEAIQRLSVDACEQTAAVSGTLREISRTNGVLCNGADSGSPAWNSETAGLADGLKELLASIRGMNLRLLTALAEVDESVQTLSNDIETATEGLTVHATVAAEVELITADLERIVTQAREVEPEAAEFDLTRLSRRYTMQSERVIHDTVLNARGIDDRVLPAVEQLLAAQAADDGLGANVELF